MPPHGRRSSECHTYLLHWFQSVALLIRSHRVVRALPQKWLMILLRRTKAQTRDEKTAASYIWRYFTGLYVCSYEWWKHLSSCRTEEIYFQAAAWANMTEPVFVQCKCLWHKERRNEKKGSCFINTIMLLHCLWKCCGKPGKIKGFVLVSYLLLSAQMILITFAVLVYVAEGKTQLFSDFCLWQEKYVPV